MNIPIRSGSPAFDVMERRGGLIRRSEHTVNRQPPGVLSAGALELPSGRDVSRELDVLFSRLAARAAEPIARRCAWIAIGDPRHAFPPDSSRGMIGELPRIPARG